MDYNLIGEIFNKHIKDQTNLDTGAEELDLFLKKHFQIPFLNKIDIKRLDKEFQEKVKSVLSKKQVPNKIKSIYFGLVTLVDDNDTPLTSIHITGSKSSPEEDLDWACDVDYKGNSYIHLKDFSIIDSNLSGSLDNKGIVEVIIFNGLLNLMLINSQNLIKSLTFNVKGLFSKPRQTLWFGGGFDSGDCHVLGQIK